jgi:hypothetical protein
VRQVLSTGTAWEEGADVMQSWTRLVAVAAIALGTSACQSAPQAGDGWVQLFDGKTLNGWTPKIRGFPLGENYADTFRVRDGAIVVSYDKYDKFGERFGHLFYNTPINGAYRLRVEYRFLEGHPADTPAWAIANSGVMIYGQDPKTMAVDDSFPVSVEAQLLGTAPAQERYNGNMCSPGTNVVMNGKLETTHCINSKTPSLPNGQWISFQIDVDADGKVTQSVNGAPTITYSAVQLDPEGRMANSKPLIAAAGGKLTLDGGTISLQSEGNPIEFRKVEMKRLD